MPNQPENNGKADFKGTLYQGAYPPPNPVIGDVWIDPFDTTHEWQGYYWVKIQGPTVVTEPEPFFIGHYDGYSVYYGYPRPDHGNAIYWVSDGKPIDDAEIFESITEKKDPAGLGSFKKSHWQHVSTPYITEAVKKFVSGYLSSQGPIPPALPEVSLAADKCSEEEAAEKFNAFEEAADLTGRLDVMKQHEKNKATNLTNKLINWLKEAPNHKPIKL